MKGLHDISGIKLFTSQVHTLADARRSLMFAEDVDNVFEMWQVCYVGSFLLEYQGHFWLVAALNRQGEYCLSLKI